MSTELMDTLDAASDAIKALSPEKRSMWIAWIFEALDSDLSRDEADTLFQQSIKLLQQRIATGGW